MTQGKPIEHEGVIGSEVARKELERLAAEKGVQPIRDLNSLRVDFWPEDESVDDFVRSFRERRHLRSD